RLAGDDIYYQEINNPKDLAEYIEISDHHAKGQNLPENWVSYSTFWLIDNDEFIGEAHIRHSLTPHLREIGGHIGYTIRPDKRRLGYGKKILTFCLEECKKLGINPALITCDETNLASKKIIESNGGIFEKANYQGEGKPLKLLYWIKI
ncbi:GNAT family N-acetyltransferase, partial [Candidatus Peregrinibacteria bacterium]|nr:GNAT family N-acetyltransferase [Candidatus Peregrinibacteria bacterium]